MGDAGELDIERLRAENQALKDELTELRAASDSLTPELVAALENLPVVLWAIDPSGRITLSDGRGLSSLGLEPGQLVGANVFDLYKLPEHIEPVRRGLEGTPSFTVAPTERGIWWETRYFPQFEDGEVVGLYAFTLDVTPQKVAELAKQRADEMWRTLAENSPDFIAIVDRDYQIQFLNRVIEHESPSEFVGTSLLGLVPPEKHAEVTEAVDATFAGEVGREYEASHTHLDGRTRWYQNRLGAIRNDDGVESVLVVTTDITEQRDSDREREQLRAQVMHAQKLESLGVLAGGIAHDFNNLLVSVIGHADLARLEASEGSLVAEYVDEIIAASQRAAGLCEQMLSYAGRTRMEIRDVDLSKLTMQLARLLAVTLPAGVGLEQQLDPRLPLIAGDPTQLEQVVMNLVTNASDAMKERTGRIHVSTDSRSYTARDLATLSLINPPPSGEYVVLEVTDEGVGMSADTCARMFDPFFSTKMTGRGLGMASVLGIVASHGGSIGVQSKPGEGTTVRVLFPALHPSSEADDADEASGETRPQVVLVVDDEPSVRLTAIKMLKALGYQTLEAEDGVAALEVFSARKGDIDLVFLDLTMPRMGGLEACAELGKIDPDVRILLTTGYDEGTTPLPEYVSGLLRKPYQLADLRNATAEVLSLSAPS